MQPTKITADAFRSDNSLLREIEFLAAPNYEDASALLEREVRHCTQAYLIRDNEGVLLAFFLVAFEYLSLSDGTFTPALYLGLSAAQHTPSGAAAVMRLYGSAIADAMRWEQQHGNRLVIWSTTASPMIYKVVSKYLSNLEPSGSGDFSSSGRDRAHALARHLGAHTATHPFVLKGYAANTRYSQIERRRIDLTLRAQRFELFKQLAIDESAGDRLLMIASTPYELPKYLEDRYVPVLSGDIR